MSPITDSASHDAAIPRARRREERPSATRHSTTQHSTTRQSTTACRWGRPRLAPWIPRWASMLDSRWELFGFRFGLDGLIGLVPVIGDLLTAFFGGALLIEGYRLRLPTHVLARMAARLAFDAALGSVPVLGDAMDFLYKPNEKNLRTLQERTAHRG